MLGCTVGFLLLVQATVSYGVALKNSRVIAFLRDSSDSDVIPITVDDDEPVAVDVGFSLISLRDVDRERNEIELIAWLQVTWDNKALAWDRYKHKPGLNVTSANINRGYLWSPDLTIYNGVITPEVISPDIAIVSQNGSVIWVPNMMIRATCDLANIESEEGVSCNLIIGSWTYNGYLLRLTNNAGASLAELSKNPGYDVTSISSEVFTRQYPCCPEPYMEIDVKFQIVAKTQ